MAEPTRRLFHVGEEAGHHVGDPNCPLCLEEYPAPCRCGGLMHAAGGTVEDPDGNPVLITRAIAAAAPRPSSRSPGGDR